MFLESQPSLFCPLLWILQLSDGTEWRCRGADTRGLSLEFMAGLLLASYLINSSISSSYDAFYYGKEGADGSAQGPRGIKSCGCVSADSSTSFTKMVKFSPSFFILLSSALVTASVIPLAGLKRELDSSTPVAREPKYPLYLAKRKATGRKTRHVRPDYGAMSEHETRHVRPDYGAMSDPETRHERPDYGAMSDPEARHIRPYYGAMSDPEARHIRPDYGAMSDPEARHIRPDYGAMNNHETRHVRPDYGAMSDPETRHIRPDYGAMNEKRDIALPDLGQVITFPPTGIPQQIRGPWGDSRISASNKGIDRQNSDHVVPPLSDKGLLSSRVSFSLKLIVFYRRCSQFEVVFLFVAHQPT
jgi:hypothetical protein